MVLVDTVVLDKEGHPVKGLKADDFTLTEGGVPQRIASFSERVSEAANQALPPVIPPHVTTNRPVVTQSNAENQTIAVLMLDGLNTPPKDQIYVKQQMLKFLARQYDPNIKLAVIALTNKLTVLQNFTQDPLLLRAALNRYLAETPALARSGGQMETPSASVPAPTSICRLRPRVGRLERFDRSSRHPCGRRKQLQHLRRYCLHDGPLRAGVGKLLARYPRFNDSFGFGTNCPLHVRTKWTQSVVMVFNRIPVFRSGRFAQRHGGRKKLW